MDAKSHSAEPRRWDISTLFLVGGVLVCLPLFFLFSLEWLIFLIPLPLYFLIGSIAAIITKRSIHILLAYFAHLSLLLVLLNGTSALLPLLVFGIIAALFTFFWGEILNTNQKRLQKNSL